jgi:hypothetical protein
MLFKCLNKQCEQTIDMTGYWCLENKSCETKYKYECDKCGTISQFTINGEVLR